MCRKLLQLSFFKPAFLLGGGLGLAMLYFLSLPACKQGNMAVDAKADTTSHDFAFQIDTLGDGNSSLLNDVFIIDERNVWAVGEIYVKDATGQFVYPPYNAVHWNGNKWSMVKVPVRDYGGFTSSFPLKAVLGFAPNDVWFASDADLIHWNGSNWSLKAFFMTDLSFNGQVLKMWGMSGSNLYLVGRNGAIYHFNGSSWQKLASGTTVDIQDIWGAVDGKTGQQTVLALASFLNYGRGLDLLKIDGMSVTKLDTAGLHVSENSLWFEIGKRFYVTGFGVYSKVTLNDPQWRIDDTHPLLYKDRIRGNAWNDIFVAGSGGLMSHYNGSTWKHYTGMELPRWFARYQGLSVKNNLVVAVGWLDEKAVIVRGVRS